MGIDLTGWVRRLVPAGWWMRLPLLLLIAVGLGGCGQKGPLYLPPPEPDQTREER